jgi:hypothetical protein
MCSAVGVASRRLEVMTVSELIDNLRAMPSDATVMLWSQMDEPHHRRVERVELSTPKSDPAAEVVVLS